MRYAVRMRARSEKPPKRTRPGSLLRIILIWFMGPGAVGLTDTTSNASFGCASAAAARRKIQDFMIPIMYRPECSARKIYVRNVKLCELVAGAFDGEEEARVARVGLDLLPQAGNVDVDGAGDGVGFQTPNVLQ